MRSRPATLAFVRQTPAGLPARSNMFAAMGELLPDQGVDRARDDDAVGDIQLTRLDLCLAGGGGETGKRQDARAGGNGKRAHAS